jgi:dihydroorotase
LPKLPIEKLVALFSTNARSIFNLPAASIIEGGEAELTLFNTTLETCMTAKESKSKSANSPFWDKKMNGKIIGTIAKGNNHIN